MNNDQTNQRQTQSNNSFQEDRSSSNASEAAELARAKIRAIFDDNNQPQNPVQGQNNQQQTQNVTPQHNQISQQQVPQPSTPNAQAMQQQAQPAQQSIPQPQTPPRPSVMTSQQSQQTINQDSEQTAQHAVQPQQTQPSQQSTPNTQANNQTNEQQNEQNHELNTNTAPVSRERTLERPLEYTRTPPYDSVPSTKESADQTTGIDSSISSQTNQASQVTPQQAESEQYQSQLTNQEEARSVQQPIEQDQQATPVQQKTNQNILPEQQISSHQQHTVQPQAQNQQLQAQQTPNINQGAEFTQNTPVQKRQTNQQAQSIQPQAAQIQQSAQLQTNQQQANQSNTPNTNANQQTSNNNEHRLFRKEGKQGQAAPNVQPQQNTVMQPQNTNQQTKQQHMTPEQAMHAVGLDQAPNEEPEIVMDGGWNLKSWLQKLPFFGNKTKHKKHDDVPSAWKPLLRAVIIGLLAFGFLNSQIIVAQVKHFTSPTGQTDGPLLVDPTQQVEVGDKPRIIIPKINVNAPVVYDEKSFDEERVQQALQRGVVHYGTTALPGEKGNNVIVGHSSANWWDSGEWKFAFVLLDKLEEGDTFELHYQSTRYVYRVTDKFITEPTDVSVLKQTDTPTATLITCNPPGSAWRRLIIKADQVSPDPAQAKQNSNVEVPESLDAELPSDSPTLFDKLRDWIL